MVKLQLRSLERRLVKERVAVAVHDFVENLPHEWHALAADQPTDITQLLDLIRRLWDANTGLPTMPAAINYLESCLRKRKEPDPRSLISIMAPWTVRTLK